MISKLFIVTLILFAATQLFAQPTKSIPKENNLLAPQELEAVIIDSERLQDKSALVSIRARAAMLVSFSDPVRSEDMFLQLWKFVSEQDDKGFDKDQARLQILRSLSSRNPSLARRLLAEQSKPDASPQLRATGNSRLDAKLAFQLVDTDPSMAAALVEASLVNGPSPAAMGALLRLRDKDSILSDYVAAKALDGIANEPTLVSLPGLFSLTAYVFPGSDTPMNSIEAEASLQRLQFKYFLAGYDLLRASLKETNEVLMKDQHYAQRDLQFRAAYQGQIASILAALAPRLQPSLAVELSAVADKLGSQVPANISQMTQPAMARLRGDELPSQDPEQRFVFALTKGDFDEARKQLDLLRDDDKKKIYAQLLLKNEAKALLAKSDVMGAITAIRKLEDQTTRLIMYLEGIKAARKKRDPELTNIIINEARLLIPQTDRNGLHVRALLSFSAQLADLGVTDDAMDFLNNAVTSINTLTGPITEQRSPKSASEAAMAELNDPNSLLDASEMEQAFSSVGLADLARTLMQAKRIQPRSVQLVARLEAIQRTISRPPVDSKTPRKPPKASSESKQ